MYDRFTERSRKVMQLARREADTLGHNEVGTGAVLLALIKEGEGVATGVLKGFGLTYAVVKARVAKLTSKEPDREAPNGQLRLSQVSKAVIGNAEEEMRALGHQCVGTEHLLLGILSKDDCTAARVMMILGLGLDEVRDRIMTLLRPCEVKSPNPEQPVAAEEENSPDLVVGAVTKATLLQILNDRGYGEDELKLVMAVLCASVHFRVKFLDEVVSPIVETHRTLSPEE